MTLTDTGVSEELVLEACDVFLLNYDPPLTAQMRAVLNAIAPRLRAEGLRGAHNENARLLEENIKLQRRLEMLMTETERLRDRRARFDRQSAAPLVGSDALDPPPQQEEKK